MLDKIIIFFARIANIISKKIGLNISVLSWEVFLRYCTIGVVATAVDFGFLYILTEYVHLWYILSATISFILAAATNYVFNRNWTFKNSDERIIRQITIFLSVTIVGLFINNSVLYIGVEYFGLWYILAKVIGTVFNLIWNFFGNRYITFK